MNREEAKQHFWRDTEKFGESVAKRFGSINYNKIFTGYYIGSEIDNFIDKIYDDFEKELQAKDKEIESKENDISFLKKELYKIARENDKLHKRIKMNYETISEQTKIINELESRTCNNCKYYESYPSVCCNGDSPLCADVVDKDFGCNLWESKE